MTKVWINGKLFDKSDAKISVFDHGLLYGDGVFEGIRAYSGRVFRLKQHVERLYESARGIHLEIPTDIQSWSVLLVNVGAVAIAVFAAVLPALRAALLHPVRALRYE